MENLRNLIDVKIVQSWETDKIGHLVANPSFTSYDNVYLAGIRMYKSKIFLNKPIYTGVTILKNSKILMYSFYGYLKAKYGPNCKGLFTDTNSFPLNIQAENVYKLRHGQRHWLYDSRNYPKELPLYSNTSKKVLGKLKDESEGRVIEEAVTGLGRKPKDIRKAQGVKKNVVGRGQARVLQRSAF